MILVDSGATHNFISQHLVHKMNWAVTKTPPLNIKLGDGSCSKIQGTCQNLAIEVEGLQVTVDAQLFDLGGMDVVLGIEWLRTLGDMIINWKKHTMSFWYQKEWVTLKGVEGQFGVMETLQSILSKPKRSKEVWGCVEMKGLHGHFHALEVGQSRTLEHLLNLCADVFKDPVGLPPKRKK
jgi:hypothetical protein